MDRKERTVKILKRCVAAAVLILPCLIYYFCTRKNAGESLLYTAPFLWVIAALSLAAALFSYIILRRSSPEGYEEVPEERENIPETVTVSAPAAAVDFAEYPEFAGKTMPEDTAGHSFSSEIARAIEAQKGTLTEDFTEEVRTDDDFEWDETTENGDFSQVINELYENIPDTLPEGYTATEDNSEEAEFCGAYRVKRSRLGETVLSKVLCVIISAVISSGAAFLCSGSITKETEDGYTDGKEYTWQDAETVTVSEKLFGSLSVEVTAKDGNKTELFPATLIKGENFGEKYESIYAYMAHAVREMRRCGAEIKMEDEDSVTASYKDAEDGSWKYISEIVGENEK